MKSQTLWEELAEQVGPDFARALINKFGGDYMHIPSPESSNECSSVRNLSEILGDKLAAVVRREFRGLRVYVPSAAHVASKEQKMKRDREILAMKAAGALNRDIIRIHGISSRRIQVIVARERTS